MGSVAAPCSRYGLVNCVSGLDSSGRVQNPGPPQQRTMKMKMIVGKKCAGSARPFVRRQCTFRAPSVYTSGWMRCGSPSSTVSPPSDSHSLPSPAPSFPARLQASVSQVATLLAASFVKYVARQRRLVVAWTAEHGQDTVKQSIRNASRSAVILPFAAAITAQRNSMQLFVLLNKAVYQFVNVYLLVLFLRCDLAAYV
jgi:hypothetical protein